MCRNTYQFQSIFCVFRSVFICYCFFVFFIRNPRIKKVIQVFLRLFVTLLCSLFIPCNCLFVVLLYSSTYIVAITEVALSNCISLFRCFLIPFNCLFVVLLDTPTVVIAFSKNELSCYIIIFSRGGISFYSSFFRLCFFRCFAVYLHRLSEVIGCGSLGKQAICFGFVV